MIRTRDESVESEETRKRERRETGTVVTFIFTVLCCIVTMIVWMQGTAAPEKPTDAVRGYSARIMLVRDPHAVIDDANLLWVTPPEGVDAWDGEVTLNDRSGGTAYLVVSNMSISDLDLQCRVELSGAVEQALDFPLIRVAASAAPYRLELKPNMPLHLRVFSAKRDEVIVTASDIADLTQERPANSVVYVTRDLITDEALIVRCGQRIHLNGHRVQVASLTPMAAANVYGTLTVEGGTLQVGGKTMTDADGSTIQSVGAGNIAVEFKRLSPF